MQKFLSRFADKIIGVLSGFDRLLFRGSLRRLCYPEGLEGFLAFRNICRKDFGETAERWTKLTKELALKDAETQGVPIEHLTSGAVDKEEIAKRHLKSKPIESGLVCILTAVEPCSIWNVHRSREKKRILFDLRHGMCQHIYRYFVDPDFGLIHARLQTWMPYAFQVCVNGREWLAQQMRREGIGFQQMDNCFPWIEDVPRAQKLMDGFLKLPLQSWLDDLALHVHPALSTILGDFKASYFWTAHQSEWATDVMFKDPESLAHLYPSIVRHCMTDLGSDDVFRFLGKKLNGNFQGEVLTRFRRRIEGICVKHFIDRNSLKLYDKFGILRLEGTINWPKFFKVMRCAEGHGNESKRLRPLRKGISDLQLRANVCQAINKRTLDNLAVIADPTPIKDLLDPITKPAELGGRRVRALRPWSKDDLDLLAAVARGEFLIQGFRNRDLLPLLYATSSQDKKEHRRRSARISRLLRMLRAHNLIEKVTGTHRYMVTKAGTATIAALLGVRELPLSAIKQVA